MSHAVQRFSVVAAIIAASLFTSNCRSRVETVAPETIIAGEPENYSATVVRTIEDGDRREVIESRTCRMGEMRREELSGGAGGIGRRKPPIEQRAQRQRAHARAALLEEASARSGAKMVEGGRE